MVRGAVVGKSPVSDLASHWIEGWLLPGLMSFKVKKKKGNPCPSLIKTHVRGFFDTDLHEVSWHFATAEWVLSSTDRVNISVKEAIQNVVLFLSHT